MVAELQQDNPNNLYRRLTKLKMPIFLSFGSKEPYIPGTAFNGLRDLGSDIITPFMNRMNLAGNTPILKIYPDTAHFIHTDNPVEFPADVVDFVRTRQVNTLGPRAVERLMRGVAASNSASTEAPSTSSSPTAGFNK